MVSIYVRINWLLRAQQNFGLTNAPATYQRLMQECLDDLIIFSRSNEEHLEPEA